ncbi:MAG: hypothetical protein AABY15_07015 [Nanoarchaeota archaeon]
MKEEDFIDELGRAMHESFLNLRNTPVVGHIGVSIDPKTGDIRTVFIDNKEFDVGDSELGRHEVRYRYNMALDNLHAALYHLQRIIHIKTNSIEKKYCK